jgi:hypothetical protein
MSLLILDKYIETTFRLYFGQNIVTLSLQFFPFGIPSVDWLSKSILNISNTQVVLLLQTTKSRLGIPHPLFL